MITPRLENIAQIEDLAERSALAETAREWMDWVEYYSIILPQLE